MDKKKMCLNKRSFFNKQSAVKVASTHNQRVYECPICFCWHCTSKEDWRQEYVDAEWHKAQMRESERALRTKYNELLRDKNKRIALMECQIKRLKMGYDEEDK